MNRETKRLGAMAVALLLAAFGAAGAAASEPDKKKADETSEAKPPREIPVSYDELVPGDGIAMLVRLGPDTAELVRVAATARPGEAEMRRAHSLAISKQPDRPGDERLIVSLHDREGLQIDSCAFPVRRVAFHERLTRGARRELSGTTRAQEELELLVRIPYREKAAFLNFTRSRVQAWTEFGGDKPPGGPRQICLEPRGDLFVRREAFGGYPLVAGLEKVKVRTFCFSPLLLDPKTYASLIHFDPDERLLGWGSSGESGDSDSSDAATDAGEGSSGGTGAGPGESSEAATESASAAGSCAITPPDHGPGDPANNFNVVILGDGYQQTEESAFIARANEVRSKLVSREPFAEFAANNRINFYTVFNASVDEGVDHCPSKFENCGDADDCNCDCLDNASCACLNGLPSGCKNQKKWCKCEECTVCCPGPIQDVKQTHLEVAGNADGQGTCTNFTSELAPIADAACARIDPAEVDLFIVLVNCGKRGAKAEIGEKIVYLSAGQGVNLTSGLVVHEVAHAVAGLGEEYIGGVIPWEPGISGSCDAGCLELIPFPNVATLEQVEANTVPWIGLAKPAELDAATGQLVNVKKHGEGCVNQPRAAPAPQPLGAFWAAQYIREDCPAAGSDPLHYCMGCCEDKLACRANLGGLCANLCVDWLCDTRGAFFFRPMEYCTMRFLKEPFCRVCHCAVWEALAAAVNPPLPTPADCVPTPPAGVPPPAVENIRRSDHRTD